jgi:magnesium transporter
MANGKRTRKTGLPPGTLMYVGKSRTGQPRITVIDYDGDGYRKVHCRKAEDCFAYRDRKSVTWINVDGIYDTALVEKLGKHYGIHPLVQEDIVTAGQRPKMEDYDDYIFIVLKMLDYDPNQRHLVSEQMSLVLGRNFVISFQETEGDMFDPIRERIYKAKGRIRESGADFLAYAIVDAVVDSYFVILERMGDIVEDLEDELVSSPDKDTLHALHSLRREMFFFRKAVWPLREVTAGLQKTESPFVRKKTGIFLKDVYDHVIQVMDTVETFRDMISGMLETYLSSLSNRMNEIMKVLTIISTIFIPLTFVAGIYGMNFRYMPELGLWWAYPALWAVMLGMAGTMLVYFRRKGWI